jgi:formylglycine-generating enzyme required for sulfatase activity
MFERMRRWSLPCWAMSIYAAGVLSACSAILGLTDPALDAGSDASAEDTGAFDSALSDASIADEARADADLDATVDAACPTGLGPEMVIVAVSPTRSICIDRTEVTEAEYAAFRSSLTTLSALTAKVPAGCSGLSIVALASATDGGKLPRRDIPFCSAAYYCAAQGKRLCGSLEDGGTVLIVDNMPDPPMEWERACSNGKTGNFYPWGTTDPSTSVQAGCYTRSFDEDAMAPRLVGAAPACGPPGDAGPVDMIGNVWEWVNLRKDLTGGPSYTGARGGAYNGTVVGNGCQTGFALDGVNGQYRAGGSPDVGFRCCATRRF